MLYPAELRARPGLAEREGFEPSVRLRVQQISNLPLSASQSSLRVVWAQGVLAEGEGFEPPELAFNGFQDRRFQPLTHPSMIVERTILLPARVAEPSRFHLYI